MDARASRRELLVGGIGAIGAAGIVGSVRGTIGSEPAAGATARRLHGIDWRLVGAPASTRLPAGSLTDETGVVIGHLETSDLATTGAGTHLHRIHLTDGTLTAVGPSTLADAEFTIVGGTARYIHATGTYRIQQRPRGHNWGDGTATIDLTLSPSEATR